LYDDLNTAQAWLSARPANAAASGGARERASSRLAPAARLPLMSAEAWKGRKQQASGLDAQQVDRLMPTARRRARERTSRSPIVSAMKLAAMALPSRTARMRRQAGDTWEIA